MSPRFGAALIMLFAAITACRGEIEGAPPEGSNGDRPQPDSQGARPPVPYPPSSSLTPQALLSLLPTPHGRLCVTPPHSLCLFLRLQLAPRQIPHQVVEPPAA